MRFRGGRMSGYRGNTAEMNLIKPGRTATLMPHGYDEQRKRVFPEIVQKDENTGINQLQKSRENSQVLPPSKSARFVRFTISGSPEQ